MNQTALVLVGFPGSGKTTASSYFRSMKIPVVRMGDLTDITLAKLNLPKSAINEKKIRKLLRRKYGPEVYGKFTVKEIKKLPGLKRIVVVEGMKSEAELRYIQKKVERLIIIFIDVKRKIRFERIVKRTIRPLTYTQAKNRDNEERNLFKINLLKEKADFIVNNENGINEFYSRLLEILKSIKYDTSKV